MRTSSASLLCGFLVTAVLTASGCGSGNTPAASQPKAAGVVKKAAGPASTLSPYLVSAVPVAKGGPALFDVKFEVAGRPDVGSPTDVDLVIVPLKDTIDRFSGTVQGEDGLDVVAGDSIASTEKPAAGTPIHQAVKAVARRDGIFMLTVNLSVSAAGLPLSLAYSLPIISGNGLADTGTPPAPATAQSKPKPPAAAQ